MNLRVFDCICFMLLPPHKRHKLSAKASKCVFIGYSDKQKCYICYDPQHHRIRVSRNVIFFLNMYFYVSFSSTAAPNSSISTLYNFLDSSHSDLSNDTHDMPVTQLPDHGLEGPLIDVPSDTPFVTPQKYPIIFIIILLYIPGMN